MYPTPFPVTQLVHLSNAQLSTTCTAIDCKASNAIDGDIISRSGTNKLDPSGEHWLTVSMDPAIVDMVILNGWAWDYSSEMYGLHLIKVSLYKGGEVVGTCADHPGTQVTEALECERVEADMVKMGFNGKYADFVVQEVEVRAAVIEGTV